MTIREKFKKEWANSPVKKTIILSILAITLITCFQKYIGIGINLTHSLPQKVFLMFKWDREMIRDKYYAFNFFGDSNRYYSSGSKFVKILAGIPGDTLKTDLKNRSITIIADSDKPITLKQRKNDSKGEKIAEVFIFNGKIPANKYFFMGNAKNSYDSRYWGLVDEKDIIGRAYPVF